MKTYLFVVCCLLLFSSCNTLKYNSKYEGDNINTVFMVPASESQNKKTFTPKEIKRITTQVDSVLKIKNIDKREFKYITDFNFFDCTWILRQEEVSLPDQCLCYYLRISYKKDKGSGIDFYFDLNLKLIYYKKSFWAI